MDIKCPCCGETFHLDGDVADRIREQVRTKVFEKELKDRLADAQAGRAAEIELQVKKAVAAEHEAAEKRVSALNGKLDEAKKAADKVKSDAAVAEAELKSKIAEAVAAEREKMQAEIDKLRKEMDDKLSTERERSDAAKSDAEKAKADLAVAKASSDLAVKQAVIDTKSELSDTIAQLEADKKAVEYERDYYKDLKTRMSTKMVGETLEQHCEIEFNKIRMAAFPLAEFGKDNDVSRESGSKGDYIFREYDEEGNEIISIMFEMKNEMDTTATKKTNAHFFKELDKDRREKKCEYAVLVSLLEADNDLYNTGIVDVSYQYLKMYVIRPQFFITLISILRNAAIRSMDAKRELRRVQSQNVDLQNFEENLMTFKDKFSYNYEQASKRFDEAISEIDKTIDHLKKVKDGLLASGRQLRLANDKVNDVTIKRLTANSPSIRAQLEGGTS
jgi:hypothetical protein